MTEEGDDWSVLVFECAVDRWGLILAGLFELVDNMEEGILPHFKVSAAIPGKVLIISFRVFRNPLNENTIKDRLEKYAREQGLNYAIDPNVGESFGDYHHWIRCGDKNPRWVRKRCEALTHLSRLVVFLAQNSLDDWGTRLEMGHLTINMLGMREATVLESREAYFKDFVTNFIGTIPKAFKLP